MVKITNGSTVFEVTRGAFEEIYSRQSFTILGEKSTKKSTKKHEHEAETTSEKSDDEQFLEEIQEKPISQWNKEEVKRFASLKEIDITGTKNANEAKEIIKSFLEQE